MPDALVLVQDIVTIACAGFNAAYFSTRWFGGRGRASHRVAAAALTLLNAAVVVESAFFLALYFAYHRHGPFHLFLAPSAWLAGRFLLLAATAFISLLILRYLASTES